ncbi:MAG: hypothetical protein IPP14_03345 [Planctomycetes bacterium]|nr:hypothetical protein [Planctomycetota bacterium]
MKTWFPLVSLSLALTVALAVGTLAGCKDAHTEAELASTKTQLAAKQAELDGLQADLKQTNKRIADLKAELAAGQIVAEQPKPDATTDVTETRRLKAALAEQEQRVKDLETQLAVAKAAQPTKPAEVEKPADAAKADPATVEEATRRIDELLPLVKSDAGTARQREEMVNLMFKADKATRDRVIDDIQKWVKEEPGNKHAHLSLANALVSRFADIKREDFMGQATLAGKVTDAANKALEIDPDFYDAVAYLALMKVNYPPFTPEFKGANKDLDRALDLQAKQSWVDEFADVYVGYSTWFRKQGKLDDAAAKVQAGLDKAPRNEGLLAEKKIVDDARAEAAKAQGD